MAGDPEKPIALEERAREGDILSSPSAERNKGAIAEAVVPLLPEGAVVLEIGSGTGEHAETLCRRRPDLTWTPSDPNAASRASCAARAMRLRGGMQAPLELDLTSRGWSAGAPACDAIFCANTIHIAPWSVAEGLAREGAALLRPGGQIILYGPFLEGDASAPSNLDFDASLKSRDPEWGVRERADVEALFAGHGLTRTHRIEMPANNQILVFAGGAAA